MTLPVIAAGLTFGFIVILVCLAFVHRHRPISLERFRNPFETAVNDRVAPLRSKVGCLEVTGLRWSGIEMSARNLRLCSDDDHVWVSFSKITALIPISAVLFFRRPTHSMLFSGVVVDALPPQAPFEGLHGTATTTADTIRFDIVGGRWGNAAVNGGVVTMADTGSESIRADISFRCTGAAADAFYIVTTHPLDVVSPSIIHENPVTGSVEADIRLAFAFDELPHMEHQIRSSIRDLRLARVLGGQDLTNGRFDVDAAGDAIEVRGIGDLGGVRTEFLHSRTGKGRPEKLTIKTADAGGLMASLNLTGRFIGGNLRVTLDRSSSPSDGPRSGTAEIHGLQVLQAPLLTRLLTMASLSGLVSTLSNDGLTIDHARAEITVDPERVRCASVRISIDQFEMTGSIDYHCKTGRIEGEGLLVPAASLQRLVGRTPVLGAVLEGFGMREKPMLAARFTLRGPLAAPEIRVSPLSSLAPELLKELGVV